MKVKVCLIVMLIILLVTGCTRGYAESIRDKSVLLEIYLRAAEETRAGNHKEALKILEKEIRKNERGYVYYFQHGLITLQINPLKMGEIAMKDYMKAYEILPDSYDINKVIGTAYCLMREEEKAIPYLEKAAEKYDEERHPISPFAMLANAYYITGEYEKARIVNEKAMKHKMIDGHVYLNHGLILSQNGDLESLKYYYKKAIDFEPDNYLLHSGYVRRLIEMELYTEAETACRKLLEENNDFYWCYTFMGTIKMLQGYWDEGKELCLKGVVKPEEALALRFLVYHAFFTEDIKSAHEYYKKYVLKDRGEVTTFKVSILGKKLVLKRYYRSLILKEFGEDKIFKMLCEKYGDPYKK